MLKIILKGFSLILVLSLVIKLTTASCVSSGVNRYLGFGCYLSDLVRQNVITMETEGRCHAPKQQIVYPPQDSMKTYIPRGTLLYRCNDISGCCPRKGDSCQPISEEVLLIAFYTIDICGNGDNLPTPEYIIMKNHTRCGCRPRIENINSMQATSSHIISDNICNLKKQIYDRRYRTPSYAMRSYGFSYPHTYYSLQKSLYVQSPRIHISYDKNQMSLQPKSCKNSLSSRPLINGQIIRGIIQSSISPEGQLQCSYG